MILIIERGSLNYDSNTLLSHLSSQSQNQCFDCKEQAYTAFSNSGLIVLNFCYANIPQFLVILSLDICCWRCISCYHVCCEAGLG